MSTSTNMAWQEVCNVTLLTLTVVFVSVCVATDTDSINTLSEDFDVKPGGHVQEHEQNWGGFNCKFTYACQGGTHEQWVMSLSRSPNRQDWTCHVERPGGTSYLFFQQFKLEVSGVSMQSVDVLGSGSSPLNSAEYVADSSTNSVSHVEGQFGSQLTLVRINAEVSKSEL